eukprot:GEZU01002024.1.p1 GENE.GEZU01002024.1~~GEZU01002024.1.p1  ORF type:complete len:284 (+),score=75.91 GEZU01002024.1:465-1316(+)
MGLKMKNGRAATDDNVPLRELDLKHPVHKLMVVGTTEEEIQKENSTLEQNRRQEEEELQEFLETGRRPSTAIRIQIREVRSDTSVPITIRNSTSSRGSSLYDDDEDTRVPITIRRSASYAIPVTLRTGSPTVSPSGSYTSPPIVSHLEEQYAEQRYRVVERETVAIVDRLRKLQNDMLHLLTPPTDPANSSSSSSNSIQDLQQIEQMLLQFADQLTDLVIAVNNIQPSGGSFMMSEAALNRRREQLAKIELAQRMVEEFLKTLRSTTSPSSAEATSSSTTFSS